MKLLNLLLLSFLCPGTTAYPRKDDRTRLRGRQPSGQSLFASETVQHQVATYSVCPLGCDTYVQSDGTIICRENGTTIEANTFCLPDEEGLIYPDGTVMCRRTRKKVARVVVVDSCNPGQRQILRSDGSVVCRRVDNIRVVARKGPRRDNGRPSTTETTLVYYDNDVYRTVNQDCLPGEEKVIKSNGVTFCRDIRNSRGSVVYYDDGVRNVARRDCLANKQKVLQANGKVVCRKRKSRANRVVVVQDDDDLVVVKPVPVPVPVPVPAQRAPVPIPAGTLQRGADCTNARGLCAVGLSCLPSPLNGSDRWTCQ